MKKIILNALLVLTTIIFTSGCKKDFISEHFTMDELLENVIKFYNKGNKSARLKDAAYTPIWEKSLYKRSIENNDLVIIPISYNQTQGWKLKNSTLINNRLPFLLFKVFGQDSISVRLIEFFPDSSFLLHRNGTSFSGSVIVSDLEGNRLFTKKYNRDGKSKLFKPDSFNKARIIITTCYYIDWYNCTTSASGLDCVYNHSELLYCDNEEINDGSSNGDTWQLENYYDIINTGGGGFTGGGGSTTSVDPCLEVQPAQALLTTLFTQSTTFISGLNDLIAAGNSFENTITIGKDASGNIQLSSVNTGGTNTGTIDLSWPGAFADLHNHPGVMPPSEGDIYGLISINANHPDYKTRIVRTSDGQYYALVITDPLKAQNFKNNFPPENSPIYGPIFKEDSELYVEYSKVNDYLRYNNSNPQFAEQQALAYVLTYFDSGIALLKQSENNLFKRLRTRFKIEHGNDTFIPNNCL